METLGESSDGVTAVNRDRMLRSSGTREIEFQLVLNSFTFILIPIVLKLNIDRNYVVVKTLNPVERYGKRNPISIFLLAVYANGPKEFSRKNRTTQTKMHINHM